MKNKLFNILGAIHIFISLGALPAGYMLIANPDGSSLGMNISLLAGSPFGNFLIPGVFLFGMNGVLNLLNGILCFWRFKYSPHAGFILGCGLIIWIAVQVIIIGANHFLQALYLIIGIAVIFISLCILRKEKNILSKQNRS